MGGEQKQVFDSNSIKELQERLRQQAEESLELRDGLSIRELVQGANRKVRRFKRGTDEQQTGTSSEWGTS